MSTYRNILHTSVRHSFKSHVFIASSNRFNRGLTFGYKFNQSLKRVKFPGHLASCSDAGWIEWDTLVISGKSQGRFKLTND